MKRAAPLLAFAAGIAALAGARPLAAQTPAPADTGAVHVVAPGETLFDIAGRYLNDPFLWPEIFRLNTTVVRDPARIEPGQRLRLPIPANEVPALAATSPTRATGGGVRAGATRAVAVMTPGDFFGASLLMPDADLPPLGRVVERIEPSVVPVELPGSIRVNDRIYIALDSTTAPGTIRIGDRLHLFRRGREVPGWGRVQHSTGVVTIAALDGQVATAVVVGNYDVINVDDIAVLRARFPIRAGVRPQPDQGPQGEIVEFEADRPIQRVEDLVFVNLGRESGVAEGDEFSVFQPRRERTWGTEPEVEIARLQVVRTAPRTAAARVVSMRYPAITRGLPVRRIARLP